MTKEQGKNFNSIHSLSYPTVSELKLQALIWICSFYDTTKEQQRTAEN